jgi:hypothetical protein
LSAARKQSEQAAALQQQLSQLASSNQVVLAEKQRLSTQLQFAGLDYQLGDVQQLSQ